MQAFGWHENLQMRYHFRFVFPYRYIHGFILVYLHKLQINGTFFPATIYYVESIRRHFTTRPASVFNYSNKGVIYTNERQILSV